MTERIPGFSTLAIHAGAQPDPTTGARATPIYQTTSYVFEDVDHAASLFGLQTFGNIYTRMNNPTTAVLEERVAALEGGTAGLAVASGHAAQVIVFHALMQPGDEFIASRKLYGGSINQFGHSFQNFDWHVRWADTDRPESFESQIDDRTRAIFIESLANPGGTFVDIAAMMLALPVVLFPALAKDVFEAPQALGLLYSAETIGALLMTALSGWTSRVHLHVRAIVLAAAAYGVTIALAGIAPSIWVAAVFLALSGAADMISGIFRGTVWNQTIPEQMRGRLAGIEMLSYSVGPTVGQIRAGVVADAWTVRGSIASGGVACLVGVALTAAWLRDFWTYDDRTDEHAVAERELRRSAGE